MRCSKEVQGGVEIIVVLNRCTDKTLEIAVGRGCKTIEDESKNLAQIRNRGASIATGEIIVTIDADSMPSSNLLGKIDTVLNSGRYIGGGVMIYPDRWSLGIIATTALLLPAVFYYRVFGGVFYCFKKDFDAIGGFNEEYVSVEDIEFAKRLERYGKSLGKQYKNLFSAYIVTSTRKFDKFGDWYFVFHPKELYTLFQGKDRKLADKVWYDFERN